MHVTVIPDDVGGLTAHGPTAEPHAALGRNAVTVPVCPISAVDRVTGTLAHPHQYATATATIASLRPLPPLTGSVDDLNATSIAVCVHPISRQLFAVGLFTGPDRAEQWWHARTNLFADAGARCHILPLATPAANLREEGRR